MDFSSLLDSAANNAKNVSKTLNTIESEVDKERRQKLKKLELERQRKEHDAKRKRRELEAAKSRREEEEKKKFTIPKKKSDGITVDKAGIEAYRAKKEQEARDKLKKQMAEKEKLIQLRLQNFGGKANKKIGKHFGINPIDLQIRYGNDHEHVERLQKLKLREEEEMDERAAQLRTGVYRAKEMQRKTEEKLRQSGTPKQPHRVATSKSNSLAGLSSRHKATRDHFSPPPEPKKASKPAYKPPEKKRPAAPPVDFSALMRAAEDVSQGKNVKLSNLVPPPKPEVKDSRRETSSQSFNKRSTETSRHERDRDASKMSSRPSSHSSQPVHPVKPSVAPSKPAAKLKHDKNDNKDAPTEKAVRKDGRFVKKPTPPPIIPAAVPGKKYLPGDVRYQSSMGSSSVSSSKQIAPSRPSSSSQHSQASRQDNSRGSASLQRSKDRLSSSRDMERSKDRPSSSRDMERTERPREPSRAQLERERDQERDRQRDRRRMEEKQREKERIRRMNEKRRYEEQLPLRERERMRDMKRKYGDHHDEDDEEDDDDYDSDMDDFIDDTGLDEDDLYKQELEDTLKQVNPKYNKQLWKHRERTIDDRQMEARYGDIQKEEKRSARIGLLEDLKEAQTGKSIALG